jgi:hypothetical protein
MNEWVILYFESNLHCLQQQCESIGVERHRSALCFTPLPPQQQQLSN